MDDRDIIEPATETRDGDSDGLGVIRHIETDTNRGATSRRSFLGATAAALALFRA